MVDLLKFKKLFVSEVEDHLQKLNDNLLKLEKSPGDKLLLDELMRSSHTIKGSAATMEFKKMAFLTHVMEDIFDYARNGSLNISPEIMNELFKAHDILGKSLKKISISGQESDVDEMAGNLKKITGVATVGIGKSQRPEKEKQVLVVPPKKTVIKNKKLKDYPVQISEAETQELEKISHIKVPVERLDNLMDLMEELLVDKMRLEQLKRGDQKLDEITNHLSRLISDLQYQVMQSRLVPVGQIFARFPRMVRDLANEQKKDIEFVVSGGDMELDRTIIDKLGEPLVHLLRNAVDHGIGEKGKIFLKAQREKDFASIIVEDSGKGIDFEKIRQSAVRKNIISQKEAESFTGDQIISLLFKNRLSTKERVTEMSGRGIGLSIVKNFTDQIGGRTIVESPIPGGGSRFTLELPLTLAIIDALLVGVGNSVFAIPFSSIQRSIIVPRKNIRSMADYDVAVVDDQDFPLVWLGKAFDIKKENETASEITVVLVKRRKDIAGIVVDRLITQQEIIIKSLSPVLRGIKGFSGSAILGDGKTILILDIATLLDDTKKFIRIS